MCSSLHRQVIRITANALGRPLPFDPVTHRAHAGVCNYPLDAGTETAIPIRVKAFSRRDTEVEARS